MAFVIISGEIDLSVASIMGLSAAVAARSVRAGVPIEIGIVLAPPDGCSCAALFNGFWIAVVGLPSLVVTLATLIGFRGLAYDPHRGPVDRELPGSGSTPWASRPSSGRSRSASCCTWSARHGAAVLLHLTGIRPS